MKSLVTFICMLVAGLSALCAQDLGQARQLAISGRHADAEKMFGHLLQQDPDNLETMLAAAYNYAWSGQYDNARKTFDRVLTLSPRHPEALIGKGYTLAWAGEYGAAKTPFQILDKVSPGSWEAKKGLGYVYLWQGNSPVAIRYFEELVLAFPKEIEYYNALGQAYVQDGQMKMARITLESGLALEPGNRVAQELLNSTYQQAAPLELDVVTGYSVADGEGNFGLRTLQINRVVNKSLRLFLRYDNSLTLDLSSLVRQNQQGMSFTGGGVVKWDRRLVTRLDYGMRLLPGSLRQQVLSGEQVLFLPNNMALKAGGFLGLSKQVNNEWMTYLGVRVPVSKAYAIEPYYFYAHVENSPLPESRIMLNNQFRLGRGYELNLGALYGKAGYRPEGGGSNDLRGAFCSAILPFNKYIWGLASLRWEKGPSNQLTAFTAGIKCRMEK